MHARTHTHMRLLLPALIALAFAGTSLAQSDPTASDPQNPPATQPQPALQPQSAPPAPASDATAQTPTEQEKQSSDELEARIAARAKAAEEAAAAEARANAQAAAKRKAAAQKAETAVKTGADAGTTDTAKRSNVKAESKAEEVVKKSEKKSDSKADHVAKASEDKATAKKSGQSSDKLAKTGAAATSGSAKGDEPAAGASSEQELEALDLKDRLVLSHDKFELLDANRDGFIERSEAAGSWVLKTRFARLDVDKDGKLSATEFAAMNDLAAIRPEAGAVSRQ